MESLERQRFRFEQLAATTARRERRRKGRSALTCSPFDTHERLISAPRLLPSDAGPGGGGSCSTSPMLTHFTNARTRRVTSRATVPRDAEWGERFFHLADPDGHELSFARPLRPASVQWRIEAAC